MNLNKQINDKILLNTIISTPQIWYLKNAENPSPTLIHETRQMLSTLNFYTTQEILNVIQI